MCHIDYIERAYTRDVVQFLMKCRDQVSTTVEIARAMNASESATRAALLRLKKVGRVDEIHPGMGGMWHLE